MITSHAQSIKRTYQYEGPSTDEKALSAEKSAAPEVSLINEKAIRDFKKSFKNVQNERWYAADKKFIVKFEVGDINCMALYNRKGNLQHTIRYYQEQHLPRDVRHLVRSSYYDFSIFGVTEVTVQDKTAYLITIQDNNSWKTIKVLDGEMIVTEEFNKR